jgi:hypothetical protein
LACRCYCAKTRTKHENLLVLYVVVKAGNRAQPLRPRPERNLIDDADLVLSPIGRRRLCERPTAQHSFCLWPLLVPPALTLVFIPIHCPARKFFRAPTRSMHQAADMIAVVIDSELLADQLGNARGGPQTDPVAPSRRPLESRRTRLFRARLSSLQERPGEKRTLRACGPPLRRVLRQRITELALQPIRRHTSLRE